jgi:hypothetical protein
VSRKKLVSFFGFQGFEGVFDVWLTMSMGGFKLEIFPLMKKERKKKQIGMPRPEQKFISSRCRYFGIHYS